MNHPHERDSHRPLRLWPGVLAAVVIVLLTVVVPAIAPNLAVFGVIGGVVGGLAIVVWWLFFSRAPWPERIGAIVLMVAALLVTRLVVHPSVANGMMGMMLPIFAIPLLGIALVAAAAAGRRLSTGLRRASIAGAIVLACAVMTLVRTEGITGEGRSDLRWRWTKTPEERLLEQAREERLRPAPNRPTAPATPPAATATGDKHLPGEAAERSKSPDAAPAPLEARDKHVSPPVAGDARVPAPAPPGAKKVAWWPGFRGPARDGVVRGVKIATDWSRTPPVELWRRPVGPAWSSFAVSGDLIYTQEQRGDDELVSCYSLTTGEPVWRHRDPVRFWESNGGPGPRATPTVHDGRVYTVGATGVVNALDAATGAVIWSRNAASDTGKTIPDWGIASSPLVIDDLVIVATAGELVAYDVVTGNPRWFGPEGGGGYSSPHLVTIDGVPQVLLLRGSRTISLAPADGTLLWDHVWEPGVSIVQPAVTADGDVLIVAGDAMGGMGMRRVAADRGAAGWTVQERWTSRGLKPYFNDFVVHEGHAYGFDGSILAAIELETGERKWKGGRYGHGQMILLAEQDLLLVLSEDGELALVSATPDQFREIARIPALNAKTWNHPVLVGDVLLVRNGEEMVAFRLPLATS